MFSCSHFKSDDFEYYDDIVDDGDDECDDDDASKVPLNADLQSSTAKASSTLRVHQCALHNQLLCWDTKYNVATSQKMLVLPPKMVYIYVSVVKAACKLYEY